MSITHAGYIAIVGRPNVGKSTLLNCLLKEKISIISPKPQTTRWQILGIKTTDTAQMVFVDTPGLHHDEKRAMSRYLNRIASASITDADVILFVVDARHFTSEDELVLDRIKKVDKPVILVINKIDLIKNKAELLPIIDQLKNKFAFTDIVPISASNAQNVEDLEASIIKLLPAGSALFPEDQHTDKSLRFQVAEIIREKLIYATEEELPYTTTIEIEEFKDEEKIFRIGAIIWVERPGQKAIVIGAGGSVLKKVGTQARRDIEKLLDKKVFLRLWVKIKDSWTDNEKALISLGYE